MDIERICGSTDDALELRLALIADLRRRIGFDAYAFLLTDPETSVGAAPLADVPDPSDLPRLIRLRYLSTANRWTGLASGQVVRVSEVDGGAPAAGASWPGLLRSYGVGDVASMVFRDRFGCWGFLDLWRLGVDARFSDPDVAALASMARPVTAALRRCQAATFRSGSARAPRVGPIVLLLSAELQVIGQTQETEEYLRQLIAPPAGHPPIPASAYNVGAQLLAMEAGIDSNPPVARVHLADGLWLTLRAALLNATATAADRRIAVTIEEATPVERVSLFGRASGLSSRERNLLNRLVAGSDTREIAAGMFLSEHTVQDYLKSIFAKTSVHSRRTLISKALGT
ncbi:MAG TPA: helix-turn-helix transcriptional regulator [Micromonosporaceae bacterium]